MAIYKNTPPIVTSGLVLNLDSLNPQSIPLDPTVNLARWSQDFSQSVWGKSIYDTITTGSIAPDGTPTAALIDETSASLNPATFSQGSIIATSSTITYSVYTKKGTATSRSFLLRNNTTLTNFTGLSFSYNLSSTAPGWTVQDAGNDWFRLSYTQTTGITPGDILQIYAGRTGAAAAGSTQTWYLWGAQAEATSYATPYIISTATNGRRTTWQDLSGNNNTATLLSSSISGSIPVFASSTERALNFNGTSSYALVPGNSILQPSSSVTIESVFQRNSGRTIMSYSSDGGGAIKTYSFEHQGSIQGRIVTTSGNIILSGPTINSNTWYHTILTYDGSLVALYLNGTLVASSTTSGSLSYAAGGNLNIGRKNSFDGEYIQGKVSIARVYNRAFSRAEITQNYNAIKARFGL